MSKYYLLAIVCVFLSCKANDTAIIGEWLKTEDSEVIKFSVDSAIISYPYSDFEGISFNYTRNKDSLTLEKGTRTIQLVIIKQSKSKLELRNLKNGEVVTYERLK